VAWTSAVTFGALAGGGAGGHRTSSTATTTIPTPAAKAGVQRRQSL
jgi:hypothetical protein